MINSAIRSIRAFIGDERGDFSIKGLAITVGAVVVIGAVVMWLSEGQMTSWIEDVWDALGGWLQESMGLGW